MLLIIYLAMGFKSVILTPKRVSVVSVQETEGFRTPQTTLADTPKVDRTNGESNVTTPKNDCTGTGTPPHFQDAEDEDDISMDSGKKSVKENDMFVVPNTPVRDSKKIRYV